MLEMHYAIPADVPAGPAELLWALSPGGPFDAPSTTARVPITIR